MAKVNTRDAKKVKGYRVELPDDDGWKRRAHYVLRSDGAILTGYQTAIQYDNQPLYWGSRNLAKRWQVKADKLPTFDLRAFVEKLNPDAVSIVES